MKTNRLSLLRFKYNLSTFTIAKYLGMDRSRYIACEQGTDKIESTQIDALCDLYACSYEYLFGESDAYDGWQIPNTISKILDDTTIYEIASIGRIVRNIKDMQKQEEINSCFPF